MVTIQYLRNKLWHRWLKWPYRLHKGVDIGSGVTVVFLHGLGRSTEVWGHIEELVRAGSAIDPVAKKYSSDKNKGKNKKIVPDIRMLAYDLLGFGASPKPEWLHYSVDDHARAVIATLTKLPRRTRPVVLVGHSMGCLIAVRVARLRPDLVRHLVLYEMPLYKGLPDKRRYRARLKLYFNLYEKVIAYQPIFSGPGKKRAQKLAEKLAGFTLSDATWVPFIRSLKHTIMEQTTDEDIKRLNMPMDVIYGTRDQVVIRGKVREIFGEDVTHVTAHTIRETHSVSRKASHFILARIAAALEQPIMKTGRY